MGDFAYYVVEQEPAIAVHLAPWYVAPVCHQNDACKNYVGSVYPGGHGGLSESGVSEPCPARPPVVGDGPLALL